MASSKRVWFARAGSIRRGFFISISRSDGGRASGHALTNLERRSARRRLYHCWPCTRERAGPRRERYSLTPLRSPGTEIGFAPETVAPHSRSAAHFFPGETMTAYLISLALAGLVAIALWEML